MKRTVGYIVLVGVLALSLSVLAGCGGDDEASDTTQAMETTETTAAMGGDEGGVSGAEVFATNCSTCHGEDGAGGGDLIGPDLTGQQDNPREGIEAQVRNGGGGMPAFEGVLTDEEIQAVVDFVHGGMQ